VIVIGTEGTVDRTTGLFPNDHDPALLFDPWIRRALKREDVSGSSRGLKGHSEEKASTRLGAGRLDLQRMRLLLLLLDNQNTDQEIVVSLHSGRTGDRGTSEGNT
jgi:hypothetical protein